LMGSVIEIENISGSFKSCPIRAQPGGPCDPAPFWRQFSRQQPRSPAPRHPMSLPQTTTCGLSITASESSYPPRTRCAGRGARAGANSASNAAMRCAGGRERGFATSAGRIRRTRRRELKRPPQQRTDPQAPARPPHQPTGPQAPAAHKHRPPAARLQPRARKSAGMRHFEKREQTLRLWR
jgi:hypothetical protein